jgi:uncharacterized protein YcsI (UPF0317 family)
MNPDVSPQQLRQLIRDRKWTTPTSCAASGYLQANLVMLPAAEAFNFLLFCVRNPIPCPILDVLEPGRRKERGKGSPIKGFVKRKNTPSFKKIYFLIDS